MKDRFKEFLESHSSLPDVETPDDEKIWKGISAELDGTRRLRIGLLSAAAVILILAATGATRWFILHQRQSVGAEYSLQQVSQQLGAEEQVFRLMVTQKLDEVNRTRSTGDDYREMTDQLEQIDRQYQTYMADLKELGAQPKILRGIIRCYEMKIRVIEKTLKEIEKTKNYENEKHIL